MEYHEIIIVGAGASGLMCGYLLGQKGKDVLIVEKNTLAGKKLLATGNGRCNFTNRNMDPTCYYGESGFVESVLNRFGAEDAVRLFEEIGIYHRERDGYCYPYSGQAASVVELILAACRETGVHFRFDTKVSGVVHKEEQYEVNCKNGVSYVCDKLILASGGKAHESLGGDGSGYKICRSLSHRVTKIFPGLTGLKASGREWKSLAGVRMQGAVSLYSGGRCLKSESGEIQIVKDGISGIPVFQLCRLAAEELSNGREVKCILDFFPEKSEGELTEWLYTHGVEKLQGVLNQKWIPIVCGRAKRAEDISYLLKHYEVFVTDTFGMERAQVTAGGVPLDEISRETMQSELHNGLYILGELLDVDGICGGYNLHFAWATAYICAGAVQ